MADQRSVMKEYRLLEQKRQAGPLSPQEDARFAQLRELVGAEATVGASKPGFDVNAAAARLRESLLPAGLRNRPPPVAPEAAPEPAPAIEEAAPEAGGEHPLEAVWNAAPFAPLQESPALTADALFDPGTLGTDTAPAEATWDAGAQPEEAGAQAYDPNAQPYDPNAQVYDPNAYTYDANGQPYDPNAPAYDPNAQPYDPNAQAYDPSAQPYDPNAQAYDPSAQPYDPNAQAYDPNAQPYDPNAPAYDPNAQAYDPNAQPWDANAAPAVQGGQEWDPNTAAQWDAAVQPAWDPNLAAPWGEPGLAEGLAPAERAEPEPAPAPEEGAPELSPEPSIDALGLPPEPAPETEPWAAEADGLAPAAEPEAAPWESAESPSAEVPSAELPPGDLLGGEEAVAEPAWDAAPVEPEPPAAELPFDAGALAAVEPELTPEGWGAESPSVGDALNASLEAGDYGDLAGGEPIVQQDALPLDEAQGLIAPLAAGQELTSDDDAFAQGFHLESNGSFGEGSPPAAPAWDAQATGTENEAWESAPTLDLASMAPTGEVPPLDLAPPEPPPEPAPFEAPALEVGAPEGLAAEPLEEIEVEDLPVVEGEGLLEDLPLEPAAPPAIFAPPPPPPPPVAAPVRAAVPPPPTPPPPAAPAPAVRIEGTHRVVVHTVEGLVKRGVISDAALDEAVLSLAPQPDAPPESLPVAKVKAIFFMLAPGEKAPAPEGKKVRVTFTDGRQIAGFSPNYTETGAGFFMIPADTRTNTGRIWVYRAAVKSVSVT